MPGLIDLEWLVEKAALELVHRHNLDEITEISVSWGVTLGEAERLVLLIPSAFAREYFGREGIEFPEYFLTGPPGEYTKRSYGLEPFYGAARRVALRWINEARTSLVIRVLDWSAEAAGVRQAREQGLTPTRMSAVHHGFVA